MGKISANLSTKATECDNTIHVYEGLFDGLLSQSSLQALGFLPPGPGGLVSSTAFTKSAIPSGQNQRFTNVQVKVA